VLGLGFTVGASQARWQLRYLIAWDLVAATYLVTGALVMRRRRGRTDPAGYRGRAAAWVRPLRSARFNFAFTLAASLVGMSSARAVIRYGSNASVGSDIKFFGAAAILCAWLLLHAGYARFYASLYHGASGSARALEFPRSERPNAVDFMYFSFTLGASFAVSDVSVTSPSMRWHVMAHGVLSFFYNAIVLALAIGIVTGR
jgi:uncharacterized membrane protein